VFLLVPAHPGSPRQRAVVVVIVVVVYVAMENLVIFCTQL